MTNKVIFEGNERKVVPLSSEEEAERAAFVPSTITKLQLVRALRAAGNWGSVKAAISQSSTTTKEDWDYASVIDRTDPMVSTIGQSAGLSEADLDEIFRSGATL